MIGVMIQSGQRKPRTKRSLILSIDSGVASDDTPHVVKTNEESQAKGTFSLRDVKMMMGTDM